MSHQTKLLINGELVAGAGQAVTVRNPATGGAICDVADLEAVVEGVRGFSFYNAGQDCTQPCRLYVADKVYDNLVADLGTAVSSIQTGAPRDEGVEMGPIITEAQYARVQGMVERARQAGHMEFVTGGDALAALGRVDILVNNAGLQIEKTVVDSTDEDWNLLMGVNAKGIFLTCRRLIPLMAKTGGGSIINIRSISGFHADPSMALYNASKSFVHGLTRSVAVDHGRDDICCNAICPGWIATEMADQAFAHATDPEEAKRDAVARHASGRLGRPEDVAAVAVWLASESAAFVTGQMHVVDGGLTAASPINPMLF